MLNGLHDAPADAKVRVAPLFHVAHRKIHAADEGHATIHNADFTVVAVVDAARQSRKANGHESANLDAMVLQTLKKCRRHAPTAHVVVDQAHLHASGGTVDEGIGHESAKWVVFDDVRNEMNVVAGFPDGFQQA